LLGTLAFGLQQLAGPQWHQQLVVAAAAPLPPLPTRAPAPTWANPTGRLPQR